MQVEELVELIAEHGMPSRVEAGKSHMHDDVSWVHVFEIPEVIDNLKGGEFLLTTGRVIARLDGTKLDDLLQAMQEKGAVALGIELSRDNRAMVRRLIAKARAIDFPTLVFDQEVPFIEIIHLAHERILAREMELLRRSAAIHDQLRTAAVHGLSPHGILTQFVTEFGGEIMFVDSSGLTLACEPSQEPSLEFLTELQSSASTRMITCPVIFATASIGQLHYLPSDAGSSLDVDAVAQAAFVLALTTSNVSSDSEDALRSALVQRVAHGRLANGQELRRHAAHAHQDFSDRSLYMVCVRGRRPESGSRPELAPSAESSATQLRTAMQLACTELGIPYLFQAGREMRVRGVVGLPAQEIDRATNTLSGHLQTTLKAMPNQLIVSGIGMAVTGDDSWEMQRSLESAQRAALLSSLSGGRVRWADKLGGLAFLAEGVMRLGASEIQLDDKSAARLGALARAGWNKSAAAADLGVRRQTLYRFSEVMSRHLGVDLSTPSGQAEATLLYYAYRIDRLTKGDGERWMAYER